MNHTEMQVFPSCKGQRAKAPSKSLAKQTLEKPVGHTWIFTSGGLVGIRWMWPGVCFKF